MKLGCNSHIWGHIGSYPWHVRSIFFLPKAKEIQTKSLIIYLFIYLEEVVYVHYLIYPYKHSIRWRYSRISFILQNVKLRVTEIEQLDQNPMGEMS